MSEGLESSIRHDTQDSAENFPVEKEWLDAFIEGVSRFPQGFFGISAYVGDALVRKGASNISGFERAELSPEQIEKLSTLAERQHARKDKEVLPEHRAEVTNRHRPRADTINHIWELGQVSTIERLERFTEVLAGVGPLGTLDDYLALDSNLSEKLRKVTRAYVSALSSPEGVMLSKDYIATVRPRTEREREQERTREPEHLKSIRLRAEDLIYKALLEQFPEKKYPNLAHNLTVVRLPNDWS